MTPSISHLDFSSGVRVSTGSLGVTGSSCSTLYSAPKDVTAMETPKYASVSISSTLKTNEIFPLGTVSTPFSQKLK